MTAKKQPVAMRFLPHRITQDGKISTETDLSANDGVEASFEDSLPKQPSRCVFLQFIFGKLFGGNMWAKVYTISSGCRCLILRINGELSLLDLDEGSERKLTGDVEHFWVTYKQLDGEANLIEEVSWLAYGHHGMQACLYNSSFDILYFFGYTTMGQKILMFSH
jgi:hypothetical protein